MALQQRSFSKQFMATLVLLFAGVLWLQMKQEPVGIQPHVEEKKQTHDTRAETKSSSVYRPYRGRTMKVAWMMSFGGAGTSYTIKNVEAVTGHSTASNYGDDFDPCVPVYPDWEEGPFLHLPQGELPQDYILTKTHCGGYCMDCAPSQYIHTKESFLKECLTGKRHNPKNPSGYDAVTYANEIPSRAVHLIRNPFDNLVGRMHLYNKHHTRHDDHNSFNTTRLGVRQWCIFLDNKYKDKEKDIRVLQDYKDVPCHAEWYRYIQWHNLAYEVQQDLKLRVHYLYYDHYATKHEKAVDDLLRFLREPRRHSPLEFRVGKTYREFFSDRHAQAARKMTKDLMHPKIWKLIKHYFDDDSK